MPMMQLVGYRKGNYKKKDQTEIPMVYLYFLEQDTDTIGYRPVSDMMFPDRFEALVKQLGGNLQEKLNEVFSVEYDRWGKISNISQMEEK